MGIKKNAFFRDMVRVAISEQQGRFLKAWNDVWKPLIIRYKNNVDAAVDEIIKTPQYLSYMDRIVSKKMISDWLRAAEMPKGSLSKDIIEEERQKAKRPEIPREASLDKMASNPDIFYPLFKNQSTPEYESVMKDKNVKMRIDEILSQETTPNVKMEEIYDVINRHVLKDYYLWLQRNFQFIDDNVQKGMTQSMSHLKTARSDINKIVIGYLNSLDQRI